MPRSKDNTTLTVRSGAYVIALVRDLPEPELWLTWEDPETGEDHTLMHYSEIDGELAIYPQPGADPWPWYFRRQILAFLDKLTDPHGWEWKPTADPTRPRVVCPDRCLDITLPAARLKPGSW